MFTVIIEIVFAALKKFYRFMGPALFVLIVLIIECIAMPSLTDERARREVLHREVNEIVSLEEIRYDEESMDRVFRLVMKNNGADATVIGSLYITDENGKDIYNTVHSGFHDLKIAGRNTIIDYIPPSCEAVVELWIDDYKLEGLDHIYITDLYSGEKRGKRFDIEKK